MPKLEVFLGLRQFFKHGFEENGAPLVGTFLLNLSPGALKLLELSVIKMVVDVPGFVKYIYYWHCLVLLHLSVGLWFLLYHWYSFGLIDVSLFL